MTKVNINLINELELKAEFETYKKSVEQQKQEFEIYKQQAEQQKAESDKLIKSLNDTITELKSERSLLSKNLKHSKTEQVTNQKAFIQDYEEIRTQLQTLYEYFLKHVENESSHISQEDKDKITSLIKTPVMSISGGGAIVKDVPKDNKIYVRKNKRWAELVIDDSGLTIIDGGGPDSF